MAEGWKYYKHALIPTCAPHEKINNDISFDKKFWKSNKGILFARYTTDFDYGKETQWWYCIKDTPINLEDMKAKKRYEITRGLKNFDVKKIDPVKYGEQLFICFNKAAERYQGYSNSNRDKERFVEGIKKEKSKEYYAAFHKESGILAGYAVNTVYDDHVDFSIAKFDVDYINERVSAAIIYTILYEYINVQGKRYVCDGERCINHKTNIQNHLENLFGFRKAYCKLHIVYRPIMELIVKTIYPFRKLLLLLDNVNVFQNINSVLKMEEIVRKQKKEK